MITRKIEPMLLAAALSVAAGCANLGQPSSGGELASLVNAKATAVAEQVGGAGGFGGMMMVGYFEHAERQIHFDNINDLADPNTTMTVTVQNGSSQACTFHVAFLASNLGLDEQTEDADVAAGQQTTITLPCAEMIGMGALETPGAAACHLADGQAVDNAMSLPAFLGLDYECGEMYRFMLTPDTNDLDGDGDTEELIMLSQGMQMHMLDGGPMGHQHGDGGGMMGMHMGQ
jgi:hypothetical protein